jgi:hypothetical protein
MVVDCKLYDSKGYLLNIGKKIKRWDLASVIEENHDNIGLQPDIVSKVVKFINSTLQINPDNRPTIKTMLDNLKNNI